MGLLSQQYGKVIELTAGSCLTAPIICGSTCVQSAQILSTKVSVGSLNTSYDLYNNGTSYLNGSVTIDDTATAHRYKSSCRLWDTTAPSGNNFFAESGASGGDAFALGQGTGILDIWVKDNSVSELRSVFRACNTGDCIVIGRGCSANDNANIPVYVCKCLVSPVICGSTCVYSNCVYTNKLQADTCVHASMVCLTGNICSCTGCIKYPIYEARYSDGNTNYRGFFCWSKLQLGNNGRNRIVAGDEAGGGRLEFVVNNCADGTAEPNGTTAMVMCTGGGVYGCVCLQSPRICGTSCLRGATVCATGQARVCSICTVGDVCNTIAGQLSVNCLCSTTSMTRSLPTWSIMGTRYLPTVNASANLPVGWHTIFVNTGSRAGGRFVLRDTTGSRHQYVVFYATHQYGSGNSINVLSYSRYSGQPMQCIRIKDGSTYDGAALQVYVCDATNNLVAYEAGDNIHSSGWYFLNSWCCDACVPYSTSCFNACWPAGCYCTGASVNLHCIQDGGQILTGKLYAPTICGTSVVRGPVICGTSCVTSATINGGMMTATLRVTSDVFCATGCVRTPSIDAIGTINVSNSGNVCVGSGGCVYSPVVCGTSCVSSNSLVISPTVCGTSVLKSADWVCGNRLCGKHYGCNVCTRSGYTHHGLTNLDTTAAWSKPAGYMTMVRAVSSNGLPSSHGQSYFGYTVTSKRDTGGGYSALLTAYDNSNLWFTYKTACTGYPTWRKLWHDGNDGSGSGLDADTLDGQHGSYYYAASNPSGYTTCTGDITNVAAGGGISGGGSSGSVTISHADTSSQASVNNSGSNFIQDVTLDGYGHVTGLVTAAAGGGGYCSCCNTTEKTAGVDCGNVYLGACIFQCGVAQGKTTGHFRNVAIGSHAMGFVGCDPHSNVVIGYGAGWSPSCCRGCEGYCYNTFIGREAGNNFMHGTIGGTYCWGACNVAVGANSGPGSRTNGINNVMIGTNSGYNIQCGASCNLFLGHGSGGAVTTGCKCVVIGYGYGGCYQNASICAACTHVGTLNKSSGSFIIPHPDPAKTATTDLRHSYVESPTRGDNIYRWQVDVTNCCNVITLPSYYQFLNENDMVWVSPVDHFGSAYGKVTEDQCCAVICTNADGKYNVLLVGTRCDCMALNHWQGVEPPMVSTSPALSAITEENPRGSEYPRIFVCNVRKPMSEW